MTAELLDPKKKYDPENLPESLEVEIFVHYGIGKYVEGRISAWNSELTSDKSEEWARILLCKEKVTIKLPPVKVNVRERTLELLLDKKQEVLAENHRRLAEVQDKIDKLLALEGPPSRAEVERPGPRDDDIPF